MTYLSSRAVEPRWKSSVLGLTGTDTQVMLHITDVDLSLAARRLIHLDIRDN